MEALPVLRLHVGIHKGKIVLRRIQENLGFFGNLLVFPPLVVERREKVEDGEGEWENLEDEEE